MELLIVVCTIAIISSLLIPVIAAAKKQAVKQRATEAQKTPPRFTVTRTLINGEYGSAFVLTLRDASTGKEYIGIPDVTLVEVPRSATGGILCEAPITKESK